MASLRTEFTNIWTCLYFFVLVWPTLSFSYHIFFFINGIFSKHKSAHNTELTTRRVCFHQILENVRRINKKVYKSSRHLLFCRRCRGTNWHKNATVTRYAICHGLSLRETFFYMSYERARQRALIGQGTDFSLLLLLYSFIYPYIHPLNFSLPPSSLANWGVKRQSNFWQRKCGRSRS